MQMHQVNGSTNPSRPAHLSVQAHTAQRWLSLQQAWIWGGQELMDARTDFLTSVTLLEGPAQLEDRGWINPLKRQRCSTSAYHSNTKLLGHFGMDFAETVVCATIFWKLDNVTSHLLNLSSHIMQPFLLLHVSFKVESQCSEPGCPWAQRAGTSW